MFLIWPLVDLHHKKARRGLECAVLTFLRYNTISYVMDWCVDLSGWVLMMGASIAWGWSTNDYRQLLWYIRKIMELARRIY